MRPGRSKRVGRSGPTIRPPARLSLGLGLLVLAAGCADGPPPMSAEQQAVFAQAVDVELVVPVERNAMSFAVGTISAPAGATVRLVIDNRETSSPAMVHNVVVVAEEGAVDRVGRSVSGSLDHVPDDPGVLVATPLAGPGERAAVVFVMPPPGSYPFICTYPGHYQFMQGTLVSTPAE